MTNVALAFCGNCGSATTGTKFCETCGQSMVMGVPAANAVPVTAAAPVVTAAPSVPSFAAPAFAAPVLGTVMSAISASNEILSPRKRLLFPLVLALNCLGIIVSNSLFAAISYGAQRAAAFDASLAVFTILTAIAAAVAALVVAPTPRRKVIGGVLGLVYLLALPLQDVYWNSLASVVLGMVPFIALFLAWAIARPFRGAGYFGLIVGIGFQFAANYFANYWYNSNTGWLAQIGLSLVAVAGAVGASLLLERPVSLIPSQVNAAARRALVFALVPLGVEGLSLLLARGSGVTIVASVVDLALLIAAVVNGTVALRQIRTSGERGWGRATAAVIIGWIQLALVAIALIYIVVVLVVLAGAASQFGGE